MKAIFSLFDNVKGGSFFAIHRNIYFYLLRLLFAMRKRKLFFTPMQLSLAIFFP